MSLALSDHIPAFIPNIYQVVDFNASQQSAPFADTTRMVRLSANQDCWYKVGADPTADQAASSFLGKGAIEHIEVTPGQKVAFVKDTTAGKASVLEESL